MPGCSGEPESLGRRLKASGMPRVGESHVALAYVQVAQALRLAWDVHSPRNCEGPASCWTAAEEQHSEVHMFLNAKPE
jgi:hypothetical protein